MKETNMLTSDILEFGTPKDEAKAITIAIEGSDGAGKATQTEKIVAHLQSLGFRVGRVSFPRYNQTSGGTLLHEYLKSAKASDYDFVNANPKLASRIYAQDRFESRGYLEQLIAENDFVIFDRYAESNLLHQGGKLKTDAERSAFATWLYDLEYGQLGLPKPDLTIYLDLPYTISRERALRRAQEKGEQLDAVEVDTEYVKNGWEAGVLYAEMFEWSVVPCIAADETNPLVAISEYTPDEIHLQIQGIIKTLMK